MTGQAHRDPECDPTRTADLIRHFWQTVEDQHARAPLQQVLTKAVQRGVPADSFLIYFGQRRAVSADDLDHACAALIAAMVQGQGNAEVERQAFLLAGYLTKAPPGCQPGQTTPQPQMPLEPDPTTERLAAAQAVQLAASLPASAPELGHQLADAHAPVIEAVEATLRQFEGRNFGYETNRRIAEAIQETLDLLGLALACPKEGCGRPAKIRCRRHGRSKSGNLVFEHWAPREDDPTRFRQTNHGGSATFPRLRVVPTFPAVTRISTEHQAI